MGALSIQGIHKTYNDTTHILKGIDLEIEAGEFLILVGPSGCGKSTLLRMVAGLEEISGGEVAIGGKVVDVTTGEKFYGVGKTYNQFAGRACTRAPRPQQQGCIRDTGHGRWPAPAGARQRLPRGGDDPRRPGGAG